MTTWFRFHVETLDNPKAQRLPPALFKTWANLLCVAAKNDGQLPPIADVAFLLRTSEREIEKSILELISRELLDVIDGVTEPHNWNARQYKSDVADPTNAERQNRYREKKRNAKVTDNSVMETVTHKRPETETETETETDQKERSIPQAPDDFSEAIEVWNETAQATGLPKIQRLTEPRSKALKARLTECGGIEGWRIAIGKVRDSPFLRGDNAKGWKADFDFVLQAKSFTKLMEGSYDRTGNRKQKPQRSFTDEVFAALQPDDDQGPEPFGR